MLLSPGQWSRPQWMAGIVFAAVLGWVTLVLVQGVRTAFCFDEIWSLQLTQIVPHWWSVFTSLHHDNNHYLNTLWMWLLGWQKQWALYRLPAVAAGFGSLFLFARIGFRRSILTGIAATVLGGMSFILLLYFTEARGYGTAVFFVLFCVDRLELVYDRRRRRDVVLLNLGAVLGFLSHLTFLFPLGGMIVFSAWEAWRRDRSVKSVVREVAALFGAPLLTVLCLYMIDLRMMRSGGGPRFPLVLMVEELFLYSFGEAGRYNEWHLVSGGIALIAVIACVRLAWRGERRWILYAAGGVLAPALVLGVLRPEIIYPRHFLTCAPLLLLLLADFIHDIGRSRAGLAVGMVILVAATVSNVRQVLRVSRYGRGQYLQAVQKIVSESNGPTTVSGDNDVGLQMMFSYYSTLVENGHTIRLVPGAEVATRQPEWMLFENYDAIIRPQRQIQIEGGASYRLADVFPYSTRIVGNGWLLYRKEQVAPTSAIPAP